MRVATQPVKAPDAKVATQPVDAPGARSVVHTQPTGTGSEEVKPVDQSLTSKKTVSVAATGVLAHSDSEDDQHSEQGSPACVSEDQSELSDGDTPKNKELELSEQANYCKTMRGKRYFMGWHQVLDFDTSSSSLPVPEPNGLVKCLSSCQQMSGFVKSWKN